MTKRKADRARCDIQERKKRRKQKGPLRHLIIQPATLLRYREAVHSFVSLSEAFQCRSHGRMDSSVSGRHATTMD